MEEVGRERLVTRGGESLMPGKHTEQAFESAIEHHLVTAGGYEKDDPDKFDP